MSLNPATRARIQTLLADHRVVLFMKGSRDAPQCGLSAATTDRLNALLDDYATVDVLADAEIRQGIKEFGNWPTIPQLYIDGELVGGADIVQSMYDAGELQRALGVAEPDRTPPTITISDAAVAQVRAKDMRTLDKDMRNWEAFVETEPPPEMLTTAAADATAETGSEPSDELY